MPFHVDFNLILLSPIVFNSILGKLILPSRMCSWINIFC